MAAIKPVSLCLTKETLLNFPWPIYFSTWKSVEYFCFFGYIYKDFVDKIGFTSSDFPSELVLQPVDATDFLILDIEVWRIFVGSQTKMGTIN